MGRAKLVVVRRLKLEPGFEVKENVMGPPSSLRAEMS
jgi:hypothetical protein